MNIWEGGGREERETNHKRLLMIENKLWVEREVGGRWARWVMGIKESTCDEHLGVACKR